MLVPPFSEEPLEHELVLPQPEALLADVLVFPKLVESLARVLVPSAPEKPLGVRSLSPTDGGVAGDRVCVDVTRGSPECLGGGGALGEVVA